MSEPKRYSDPRGRFCGCGKPALKRKCGAFVCADCDAIEQRREQLHSSKCYTQTRRVWAEAEAQKVQAA